MAKNPMHYSELNELLGNTLRKIKAGKIANDAASNISKAADKMNKNNLNAIKYKKLTNSPGQLPFFENKE